MMNNLLVVMVSLVLLGNNSENVKAAELISNVKNSIVAAQTVKIEDPDFRNDKWGITMEEVENNENTDLGEIENTLIGDGVVADLKGRIFYYFTPDDKLQKGNYAITEEYSNGGQHILIYESLKKDLIEIYNTIRR